MVVLRMSDLILTSNKAFQKEEFLLNANHYSQTVYSQHSEQCVVGFIFDFEIGDSGEKNAYTIRHQYHTYK